MVTVAFVVVVVSVVVVVVVVVVAVVVVVFVVACYFSLQLLICARAFDLLLSESARAFCTQRVSLHCLNTYPKLE